MIDDLPPEVQAHILLFIHSADDLLSLQFVSKLWYELTESRDLWKRFCFAKHRVYRMELYDGDWKKCYNQVRASTTYPVNRIVVHAVDGNYFTIAPDGTDIVVITSDHLETSKYYGQATWSPHCDRIAIAQYRVDSHKSNVILYNVKQQQIQYRYETPQHPFYFYYSPDSTRLTFLSNWPIHSIAMHHIDLANPALKNMGDGRPFYYSMHPSGRAVALGHISLNSLVLINLISSVQKRILHSFPLGSFSAPSWISDNEIVYVRLSSEREMPQLVRSSLHETMTPELLQAMPIHLLKNILLSRFISFSDQDDVRDIFMREIADKYILCTESVLAEIENEDTEVDFVVSPNGQFIAYTDGSLYLADINKHKQNNDHKAVLIHRLAIAFFWSPNSQYLLFITQSRLDLFSHNFEWWVYDTSLKESYKLTEFSASAEFRQHYLPFYCQYNHSITFFSPDSKYFVYVNDKTVNICGIERDSIPYFLCHGTVATWSPC